MNTLVRIVKASTPDFSNIEVSQDDRIKVMLDGIYNEIRQINNKKDNDVIGKYIEFGVAL